MELITHVYFVNKQNDMEAVMDPRAETLCPPVNPNLSSNQPLVDMGAPSDIDITNDNQFDWLELVDRTKKDGSINQFLDETDHGQVNFLLGLFQQCLWILNNAD